MNRAIQFHLLELIDWCIHAQSAFRRSCVSLFRALFKDPKRRTRSLVYFNFVVCAVLPIIFYSFSGVRKRTSAELRWIFMSGLLLDLIFGAVLIYVYRKRTIIGCQIWCALETLLIFAFLLLTLTEHVAVTWTAGAALIAAGLLKVYGLWVIYYFSLELKFSGGMITPKTSVRHKYDEDGLAVQYFSKKPAPPTNSSSPSLNNNSVITAPPKKEIVRRETDQTSIATSASNSPRSASRVHHDDDMDDDAFFMASVSDTNINKVGMPLLVNNNRASFPDDAQYSEMMMGHSSIELPFPASMISLSSGVLQQPSLFQESSEVEVVQLDKENDNIVISSLMCGGMSVINTEIESS